jgi:hypothetical protein
VKDCVARMLSALPPTTQMTEPSYSRMLL